MTSRVPPQDAAVCEIAALLALAYVRLLAARQKALDVPTESMALMGSSVRTNDAPVPVRTP